MRALRAATMSKCPLCLSVLPPTCPQFGKFWASRPLLAALRSDFSLSGSTPPCPALSHRVSHRAEALAPDSRGISGGHQCSAWVHRQRTASSSENCSRTVGARGRPWPQGRSTRQPPCSAATAVGDPSAGTVHTCFRSFTPVLALPAHCLCHPDSIQIHTQRGHGQRSPPTTSLAHDSSSLLLPHSLMYVAVHRAPFAGRPWIMGQVARCRRR